MSGLIVDLFAGGGGASAGIRAAIGRDPDIAVNHDAIAIAVHEKNHPHTRHYHSDVYEVDPTEAVGGRDVELLWASPDCTHHSVAKGGKPRDSGLRMLAWVVVRWAAQTLPRVICVENVPEFRGWGPLNGNGRPIKALKGVEFDRWCTALRELGYRVDHRVLDSADYGAPTRRRRLFIVARRDGVDPVWPEPTHGEGEGLEPFRTAAQCIDWSLPCPSIFERKRPLAEKTQRRIAEGLRRFVLEAAEPFILKVNHGVDSRTGRRTYSIDRPLTSITAGGATHALAVPSLVQTGYGERKGQRPRALDIHEPLGTVVGCGQKHALVAAWLAKHYGGVYGHGVDRPASTVTSKDHHALATAHVMKLQQNSVGQDVREPLHTVMAGATRFAQVRAFLTAYYGSEKDGQDLRDPMRTITAKHRLGLVTVAGVDYQIVDIGMRMLQPHELLVAQFGEYAEGFSFDVRKQHKSGKWAPLSKADKVRLIGNSVPPAFSRAIVEAQQVAQAAVGAA